MRELTDRETQIVAGGVPLIGVPIVIGAVTGGASQAIQSEGNIGQIALGAALGAAAGFYGAVAAATTGVARAMYGVYAVGAGVLTPRNDS